MILLKSLISVAPSVLKRSTLEFLFKLICFLSFSKLGSEMSGLTLAKDTYVTSWEINLNPDDADKIMYNYTVTGPEGDVFTASSTLSRI